MVDLEPSALGLVQTHSPEKIRKCIPTTGSDAINIQYRESTSLVRSWGGISEQGEDCRRFFCLGALPPTPFAYILVNSVRKCTLSQSAQQIITLGMKLGVTEASISF